jgi:hypothetical protein
MVIRHLWNLLDGLTPRLAGQDSGPNEALDGLDRIADGRTCKPVEFKISSWTVRHLRTYLSKDAYSARAPAGAWERRRHGEMVRSSCSSVSLEHHR